MPQNVFKKNKKKPYRSMQRLVPFQHMAILKQISMFQQHLSCCPNVIVGFTFNTLDTLVCLVSMDIQMFGPDALTAVKLIEHQCVSQQGILDVRPQVMDHGSSQAHAAGVPGEYHCKRTHCCIKFFI